MQHANAFQASVPHKLSLTAQLVFFRKVIIKPKSMSLFEIAQQFIIF